MTETQLAILQGFCDNQDDWQRWDILRDAFLDEKDEVGAEWARWVKEKQRMATKVVRYNEERGYEWVRNNESTTYKESCFVTDRLNSLMRRIDHTQWLYGSQTLFSAYLFLLKCWRKLSEQEVIDAFIWKPIRKGY